MKYALFWSFILVLLIVSTASYYFELRNSYFSSNAVSAKSSIPGLFCGYNDITSLFARHGLPQNFIIEDIEKIGLHHLSIFLTDLSNNLTGLYYYDLGADLRLDTSDDFSFSLGTSPRLSNYASPVVVLDNGTISNYTLYWVDHQPLHKEIKSCKVRAMGCFNVTTVANFSISYFGGSLMAINPSSYQDKIYFAINHKTILRSQNYSSFRSCTIRPGSANYCMSNFTNYTLYPILYNYNVSYKYYSNIESLGFIITPNYPSTYPFIINYPDYTYFFSIKDNNNSIITLPTLDHDSATFLAPDNLVAVRKDINLVNDAISVINIPSITYSDIDILPVSINKAFFLEFSPSNIVLLYRIHNLLTFGKAFGRPVTLVYNNTLGPEVTPKFALDDNSIIGFTSGNSGGSIVKFDCSP
ncbi:MAG: hypothetical protein AABW71_03260 [Nanoarchaeota archaeon]